MKVKQPAELGYSPSYYLERLADNLAEALEREMYKELDLGYDEYFEVEFELVIKRKVRKHFQTRTEFLEYLKEHSLPVPKCSWKEGGVSMVDGEPKPFTTLKFKFEHEGVLYWLTYCREGFPTKHCKVVEHNSSYQMVVCELPSNTQI